jgi:hypothetical protein
VKGDIYVPGISGQNKSTEPEIVELLKRSPHAVSYQFPVFNAVLDYMGDPYLKVNESKKLKLSITDNANLGFHHHQWLTVKWHTPEGIKVLPGKECSFFMKTLYQSKQELEFEILAENLQGAKVELLIDISANGRHSYGIIKVILIPSI